MNKFPLEQIRQLPQHLRLTIPETYLDDFGHMNVRWYMSLFNDSILDMFGTMGMTADYFESNQRAVFALEQHIHYLSEIRAGEQVTSYSRVIARSAKRTHFMHFLVNDSTNAVSASIEAMSIHIDRTVRRSMPYPQNVAEHIDAIIQLDEQRDWPAPLCGVLNI